MNKKKVQIYTDGACFGNPGPGGWGVLLRWHDLEKELCGGELNTTNNRMELMAAIKGLEALKRAQFIELYTDSRYVHSGVTQWMQKWKQNGWRTANKKPVKNEDLWRRLEEASVKHRVTWHWVKAHIGNVGNERADSLAKRGAQKMSTSLE